MFMVLNKSLLLLLLSSVHPSSLSVIKFGIFFLAIIPFASPLYFNLTNIGPLKSNTDILIQGDAYITAEGIQVTPNEIGADRSVKAGRAIYREPFHLWDNASGQLADFSTNFTFVIGSNRSADYADGLTFFLAHNNSAIMPGGSIGLPVNSTTNVAIDKFVAVEFDTFLNSGWDPTDSSNPSTNGEHVGIDISSLTSVTTAKWFSNIPYGKENEAWINYDSVSKNLSVSFTGFLYDTKVIQPGLSYTVDLRMELPEWVIFGFTAATGFLFEKNNVKSWSFNSSDFQTDKNNEGPIGSPIPPKEGNKANEGPIGSPIPQKEGNKTNEGPIGNKTGVVVGLSIGACVFVGLALIGFVLWKKTRREYGDDDGFDGKMNHEFEMGSGAKMFSYDELARATSNFAEKEKLGEGGFGGVYKGYFRESDSYVAVKRVSKTSQQGIKEYKSEVKIISRLRHRNLVQLIGWCHQNKELLLVYEFMEKGSLDSHLFKGKSLLAWGVRYKISQGLAYALHYLHEEWEQCILHRDIKSSNIMLDSNFNAKLGDFGLAKLVDHEKGSQTTVLAGTNGYMAPECYNTGKATKETDVFSFGVVALEIVCGRKPIEIKAQADRVSLVEWVWELYGTGKLLEAVDPRLGTDFDEEEVNRLMIVGLCCAHPDENNRPSMRRVISVLNDAAPLPILPSKMPVATYFAPPLSSLSDLYGTNVPENSQTKSSNYSRNTDSSNFTSSSAASSSSTSALLHGTEI